MTAISGATTASASSQFIETPDSCAGSVNEQLAILILETQEQRKEIDREGLRAARHDYCSAVDVEVAALKDKADAEMWGAVFEGATMVAAGGLSAWGSTEGSNSWQSQTSNQLSALAKPLGAIVGHNYGGAGAAAAQGAEQQAKWEVDDLRSSVRSADDLQNKTLDWSSSIVDKDAATTSAILSNLA